MKRPIAQLQRLCTNAHGMENKQKELDTVMQSESYDLVAIMEKITQLELKLEENYQ